MVGEYALEVYDGCVHTLSIEGEGSEAGVCVRVSFREEYRCMYNVFIFREFCVGQCGWEGVRSTRGGF